MQENMLKMRYAVKNDIDMLLLVDNVFSFICGILLLIMHIGIYLVLDVAIKGTYIPMIIFMLNPLYLIWIIIKTLKSKFKIASA